MEMPLSKLLLILIAAAAVPNAYADLFPISDVSYPHLVITDPASMPVTWHRKSMAFMLAHSAGVRINARCVFLVTSLSAKKNITMTVVAFNQGNLLHPIHPLAAAGHRPSHGQRVDQPSGRIQEQDVRRDCRHHYPVVGQPSALC